jgi:hypothetical protein
MKARAEHKTVASIQAEKLQVRVTGERQLMLGDAGCMMCCFT